MFCFFVLSVFVNVFFSDQWHLIPLCHRMKKRTFGFFRVLDVSERVFFAIFASPQRIHAILFQFADKKSRLTSFLWIKFTRTSKLAPSAIVWFWASVANGAREMDTTLGLRGCAAEYIEPNRYFWKTCFKFLLVFKNELYFQLNKVFRQQREIEHEFFFLICLFFAFFSAKLSLDNKTSFSNWESPEVGHREFSTLEGTKNHLD